MLRVDKKVHKFFDTQDVCERRPNHTLLENTGVLRGVAVRKLSSAERFTCLERAYREGAALEEAASAAVLQSSHFSGALSALQSVHGAGYIHGDVRFANIIYDGKATHLIDYELARERTASPSYPLTSATCDLCVGQCVCVCTWRQRERERGRGWREGEREGGRDLALNSNKNSPGNDLLIQVNATHLDSKVCSFHLDQ